MTENENNFELSDLTVNNGEDIRIGGAEESQEDILHEVMDRLDGIDDWIERIRSMLDQGSIYDNPFFAQVNTDGTWQEVCVGNGTNNTLTSAGIRNCNDSTHSSAAVTLAAGQELMVAVRTDNAIKYIRIPATSTPSVPPDPPIIVPALTTFANITGNSSLSAVEWEYTIQFPDNSTAYAYNAMEPLNGTPGSLGVDVGTDGSVTGTACYVKPIGNTTNFILVVWNPNDGGYWSFTISNSAGA